MEWFGVIALALWYKSNQEGRGGIKGDMVVSAPIASNSLQEQQALTVGSQQRLGRQPVYYSTAWKGKQTDLARQISDSPLANKFINNPAYVQKYNDLQAEAEELADQRIAINLDPLFVQVRSPSIPVETTFRNKKSLALRPAPEAASSSSTRMSHVYNSSPSCFTFDTGRVGVY